MANPGGVGTKFVSVNLNKSYGSVSHHNHTPYGSNSYGQAAGSRVRPGSNVSGGGGGGGSGMVVLSRPRSSQKAAPKLSVPPPLNLPSLRKEHERFDVPGSGGVSAGAAGSGSGPRPSSSGLGWTKPGALALQEKDVNSLGSSGADTQVDGVDRSRQGLDDVTRGSGGYVPPSARAGSGVRGSFSSLAPSVEKAAVLRGEDFPSLRAALPSNATGPVQKQKDGSHKQKHVASEGSLNEHTDNSLTSVSGMRPQGRSPDNTFGNSSSDIGAVSHELSGSRKADHAQKQEIFPSPLPLVQLRPRSDWADDERDTGHGFSDRGRDNGFSKSESYWDGEFDLPRNSVLPHKTARNPFDRWGKREDETGKTSASEVSKVDPYRKDIRTPSREGREGNFWRNPPHQNNGFSTQEAANDRHSIGVNREMGRDSKHHPPYSADISRASIAGNRESTFTRRDIGLGHEGGNQVDSRRSEGTARDRYGSQQQDKYRGNTLQDNFVSKSSFSTGSKGLPVNDPLLNFGKDKRVFSKTEKIYMDDPFLKDFNATSFDDSDPYTGSLFGVIKKKKDVVKVVDFHDPVRESFEAELERVQKLQEQERQRIIEEQERAMDQARREEEERQRLIREEEEMRRKVEAEAREAAWREEQEQLEAVRMAEEQRLAREEEKQRIFMEEERRKQAAKQKLLELEARMAKRQTEAPKSNTSVAADAKTSSLVIEDEFSSNMDLDNWEDSERMVERITTSGSTDPSALSRPRDTAYREISSGFIDRGKASKPWRMDVLGDGNSSPFLAQDQGNVNRNPRPEVPVGGRGFPRKDFPGGAGYMSTRPYFRGGVQEPLIDDPPSRGHSWNASGDGDIFRRNSDLDPDFFENHPEKIGDVGWGQGRSRGDSHSYPDRLYVEDNELYPQGRLRHSLRQPRVLPPPVLASSHKASFRGEQGRSGPSSFIDNTDYNNESMGDSSANKWYYNSHPENFVASQIVIPEEETTLIQEQKQEKSTPRCDSQSSLSVSSPPSSPTHLSHDDLDESGDSPVAPAFVEGKEVISSSNESSVLNVNSGKDTIMPASSSMSAADEEDWALQNNEKLQEQEEYDEDVDGYQEDDEVHDGDDEQIDLTRELEDLQLDETNFSCANDNLVLGFDEGVEVQIPNDDLEGSSINDKGAFGLPEISLPNTKEQRPVDGLQGEELRHQPSATSPRLFTESFQGRVQETEKGIHDSVVHSRNIGAVNGADSSICQGEHAQNAALSSAKVASNSSVEAVTSAMPSQVDLPLNLQFGLFSGPSLLPSPIPAIQIGSIQMPLHIHPPIGSSLTHHIPPSQPPLFQFGQFRYASPISQGILPIGSQPVPFVQSNVQPHYHLNQSSGSVVHTQSSQDCSTCNPVKVDPLPGSVDQKVSEHKALTQKKQPEISRAGENTVILERSSRSEDEGHRDSVVQNQRNSVGKPSGGRVHSGYTPSQPVWSGKDARGSKFQNRQPGINGNKFSYPARGSAPRSSYPGSEASRSDSSGFQRRPRRPVQRTEFRVRENVDRKLSSDLSSSTNPRETDEFVNKGKDLAKNGSKFEVVVDNRSVKQTVEADCSGSDVSSARGTDSKARTYKIHENEPSRTENIRPTGEEGNLKRNVSAGEDVDAPLQSGVVCVFKQPGIEGPSDEDDFIEVRSKRQMLNDRREQREKEIKAKSQIAKAPRKPRFTVKSAAASTSSSKFSASGGGGSNNPRSKFVVPENGSLANTEVSAGFTVTASQPLAPIGTPTMNSDGKGDKRPQNIKSHQPGSVSVISSGGKNLAPGLAFENKNKILDNVQTSLGSWGSAQLSQQVMVLTQTQLDEAMKPGRYDKAVASVESHSGTSTEPILPTPSILTKEKAFSSSASPINSLLAGEKIQFGAVTSPTVLPAASRTSTNGIGAPGSSRSDGQISHNLSPAQSDCALFFEKDKQKNDSHLEDCEAAAEAAASAVAVAAISSDEIVGSAMGTRAVSNSDPKTFSGPDIDRINGGVAAGQQLPPQSREESLSVALPADLSVDTPPISLWPPLPSPQNSSTPMLSHFPGGAPSPFPFYEMNPMFGGPIFAFGPHDESQGGQSQSQKSTSSASGPLGAWQQCHSSVDSFYGPPAGFAGPYVGPPGGIPGVQGPPHMVVYNHFPVGQFGQVGLSFMGTTYIPSGKQPDWKHNPTSAAPMGGISEGDMNNINMVPAQRNPLNMAGPVQHLAPGSPLLPMPSPLAMFDVSPFQSAPDMSIQGRWSHLPAPPLHPVPLSMPLQQQEGPLPPPQFTHGNPVDQSSPANRFPESRTSTSSESSRSFPVAAGSSTATTQLPNEALGLANSSSGEVASTQSSSVEKSSSGSGTATTADVGGKSVGGSSSSSNVGGHSTVNTKSSQAKNVPAQQQYGHSSGYNYQRGGVHHQRNNNNNNNGSGGGDWSHRRMGGYHGRNQMMGGEKGYQSSKVKQIYVAKQPPPPPPTTSETSTSG